MSEPFDFGAAVAELVRAIPPGRVMTYGGVAAALGSRASRQVGRVMAHEGGDLPWWRVVRAGGLPPADHETRALEMYRVEGTPVVQGPTAWRVDMRRAGWSPDADGWSGNADGDADGDVADPTLDPGFPRDPF
ncbi:MGMT family protein [Curtobacterium sp. Leaf261]|uniref:MGMT family protein n=1 Tax=Curtobacterium sp. Leaf261 TaxID=1736311 RepID=UPI000AED8B84|nr:MGMT family protein [Curtobacterium sp. Leaf261]